MQEGKRKAGKKKELGACEQGRIGKEKESERKNAGPVADLRMKEKR